MYDGFIDLTDSDELLLNQAGHGYWMAEVLREIAPECSIYAINCVRYENETDEEIDQNRMAYLEKAVAWAIEHKIDLLAYSHPRFPAEYQDKLDGLIDAAFDRQVLTTFLHCDSKNNLWPYGCLPLFQPGTYRRKPDYHICHFDYNRLSVAQYARYRAAMEQGADITSGDQVPYFSFSSMSPVLAGFLAILKSIDPDLAPNQIKSVLDQTAYKITETGKAWYDINPCDQVIDIGAAVQAVSLLKSNGR